MYSVIRKPLILSVLPLICFMVPVSSASAEPTDGESVKSSESITIIGRGDGQVRIIEDGQEYRGFASNRIRFVAYTDPNYASIQEARKAKSESPDADPESPDAPEAQENTPESIDEMLASRPAGDAPDGEVPPKPRKD